MPNHRPRHHTRYAMLAIAGILVGLAVSLTHARHLADETPHPTDDSMAQTFVDRRAAPDHDRPHPVVMDCPAPQWTVPSEAMADHLALDAGLVFLDGEPTVSSASSLVRHRSLPVVRGPAAQALLQRFRL